MFDTLSLKELRLLLRELKAHHDIRGSSKMKKDQLVQALQERFILKDGNLYLREDTRPARVDPSSTAKPYAKGEPLAPKRLRRADLKAPRKSSTKKPPAPRDLTHEQVDPLIKVFLGGLDADELTGSTVDELRDAFAARERVNMDEHKKHFRALHRVAVRG